jgi:pentatricopeptide repeat protein
MNLHFHCSPDVRRCCIAAFTHALLQAGMWNTAVEALGEMRGAAGLKPNVIAYTRCGLFLPVNAELDVIV